MLDLLRRGRLRVRTEVWGIRAEIFFEGCAQCRDNAAATPPATQRAYRRAITLLTITASGIFLTTLTILKRQR